jgi:tight adherence protein B
MLPTINWTLTQLTIHIGFALAVGCVLVAARSQLRFVYNKFVRSEIQSTPLEFIILGFAIGILVFVSLTLMFHMHNMIGLTVGAGIAFATPIFLKKYLHRRFLIAFDYALIDGLTAIASAIKAGITLPEALKICAKNTNEELGQELSIALKEYRLGVSIEEALDNLRKRVQTENANIAFGAMIVSSQIGGNLPEMLSRIAAIIRERDKVRGKLQSLTAQGRMQAMLVGSAPPFLALMIYLWDSAKFALLTDTFAGQILLALAITLEALGIYTMRRTMRLTI